MSTSPYSQVSAMRVFSLSSSTVTRWWRRYREEGHCQARKRPGLKSRIVPEEFISYVRAHSHHTLHRFSSHFGLSIFGVYHWLCRFGFKYKKNL